MKIPSKFSIFLDYNNCLNKLYTIRCAASGYYFQLQGKRPHFSYHTDGKTWYKDEKMRNAVGFNLKRQRIPFDNFIGPETITSFYVNIFVPEINKRYTPKPKDIIIKLTPPINVEIIMTRNVFELPELLNRKNSLIFIKDDILPKLIIEAFEVHDNKIPEQRYRIAHPELPTIHTK